MFELFPIMILSYFSIQFSLLLCLSCCIDFRQWKLISYIYKSQSSSQITALWLPSQVCLDGVVLSWHATFNLMDWIWFDFHGVDRLCNLEKFDFFFSTLLKFRRISVQGVSLLLLLLASMMGPPDVLVH